MCSWGLYSQSFCAFRTKRTATLQYQREVSRLLEKMHVFVPSALVCYHLMFESKLEKVGKRIALIKIVSLARRFYVPVSCLLCV